MNCTATGYPVPQILWHRNISGLENITNLFNVTTSVIEKYTIISQIVVSELTYEDNGTYFCEATNSLVDDLSTESTAAILEVLCKFYHYSGTSP